MLTKKFTCPSCDANLKAGAGLEPGTRIECPKCQTSFRVPGNKANKPAPPPEDLDEEFVDEFAEEFEEEEERRPAKRSPRKHKKPRKDTSKAPLVIALILGGVVLLGGGVTAAVVFWPRKSQPDPVARNNTPTIPAPGVPTPGTGTTPDATGTTPTTTATGLQPTSSGRTIYEANGCARCHTIPGGESGGSQGKGKGRSHDLSRVGADPTHTVEWISDHIRNPKSHSPNSRMPAYKDKIQPQDLRNLAEFLASLK
jgi:mono/diheme cytochrome c family protein